MQLKLHWFLYNILLETKINIYIFFIFYFTVVYLYLYRSIPQQRKLYLYVNRVYLIISANYWTVVNNSFNRSIIISSSETVNYKRRQVKPLNVTMVYVKNFVHFFFIFISSIIHGVTDAESQSFNIYIVCYFSLVPSELRMIRREYFNRWYSLKAYYAALTLSTLPIMVCFINLIIEIALLSNG